MAIKPGANLSQNPLTCLCVIPAEIYYPPPKKVRLNSGSAGLQTGEPHVSMSNR